MATPKEIISALEKRYAVKVFDPSQKVSNDDIATILESARLAPSSVGLEAWKFFDVKNSEVRKKIRVASYDQTKMTDASHLIVIAYRIDSDALVSELVTRSATAQGKKKEDLTGLEKMAKGALDSKPEDAKGAWLKAQAYIPLGMMIETAALLGVDTCPMEGFDPQQIDAILGLDKRNLHAATILAVGYRGNDPYAAVPKVRRSRTEVIEVID
jgi:nitroreductase